jgi:hypothetical protein
LFPAGVIPGLREAKNPESRRCVKLLVAALDSGSLAFRERPE